MPDMMDTVYSVGLLIALICAVLGTGLALLRRLRPPKQSAAHRMAGVAPPLLALLSVLAALISLGVHAIYGHGAASPEPMAVGEFGMQHKAYWFLLALWLMLLFIG
ncbi:MAG: hypothetical protein KJO85_04635, partial [Gammaproteobacteria bacterium]|nr:hypothetical protein [Gammaproteobacteria bacterium]